jgi:hypothetical protein
MSASYFRYTFFLFIAMFFVLSGCTSLISNSTTLDEQKAIERAKLSCTTFGLQRESAYNIDAKSVTCQEVESETLFPSCHERPASMKVWVVSMEGLWLFWRPFENGTLNLSFVQYHHCSVLFDLETGQEMGSILY